MARSVVTDGKRVDLPKVTHRIPWDSDFVHVAIEITTNTVTHQFQIKGGEWQTFDTWDRTEARYAASANVQSFADGKFGFDGNIDVANFLFYPRER
jgi:hypothetical protein